jgi:phospholipid/cholesterol/gamma-HCH transport system substrate-binding protein
MKFTIRFADQIVGVFIILALGILIFAIFMLGSSQRWFSRDYYFKSYFPTATGLSQNMAVQYKGFTIGHVKSIRLDENDHVEVRFTVFDTYIGRVRHGSMVDVSTSPLAALGGNSFNFYPGTGEMLINVEEKFISEEKVIPWAGSTEAKMLLAAGLAQRPDQDDKIGSIITDAGAVVATLNSILEDIKKGTGETDLGQIVGNLNTIVADLRPLPGTVDNTLDKLTVQLEPLLVNLKEISNRAADPDGTVSSILNSEGEIYKDLVKTLDSLSGVIRNLEKTTDFIPAQLQAVLIGVEDVLISLTNNPLLKRGVPERKETNTGGTYTRDLEF